MKNDDGQDPREDGEIPGKVKTKARDDGTKTALPIVITMIGIFCYLGVVLPPVFGSSTRFADNTIPDIFLMAGGALLVALGSYFWLKIRTKTMDLA